MLDINNPKAGAMLTLPIQLPDGTVTPIRVHQGSATAPTVVIWPELAIGAEHYDLLAQELVERGYNAVVGELRGQGESSPPPNSASTFGYHELATVDYPACFEVAREQFPESTPFLLGHGLGGQIGMLFAARNPQKIGGIILVGAGSPYFRAHPGSRGLGSFVGAHAMSAAASVVGYWPGDRVSAGGLGPQSKVLIADWTRLARSGRFNPVGADIDYEQALASMSLPVLSVSMLRDPLATGSAIKALVSKMPEAVVTQWRNPQPVGHSGWMVQPGSIVERIEQWIRLIL